MTRDGGYHAEDIAKLVINWHHDNYGGLPITNLRLQKLLYFLQGEFIERRNTRLIREDFYAWQLGPVIPSIYLEYSVYSSTQIPRIDDLSTDIPGDVRSVIDNILREYAERSTWDLVNTTHTQPPWMYNFRIFGNKSIIPYADIERYFSKE